MGDDKRVAKVVLLGSTGSGKSALVSQFCSRGFVAAHQETRAVEIHQLLLDSFEYPDPPLTLEFWDVGANYLRRYQQQVLHGIDVAVITFDITNRTSFEDAMHIYHRLALEHHSQVIVLLGTKVDLCSQREVAISEAELFVARANVFYMEVSAVDRTNLDLMVKIIKIKMDEHLAKDTLDDALASVSSTDAAQGPQIYRRGFIESPVTLIRRPKAAVYNSDASLYGAVPPRLHHRGHSDSGASRGGDPPLLHSVSTTRSSLPATAQPQTRPAFPSVPRPSEQRALPGAHPQPGSSTLFSSLMTHYSTLYGGHAPVVTGAASESVPPRARSDAHGPGDRHPQRSHVLEDRVPAVPQPQTPLRTPVRVEEVPSSAEGEFAWVDAEPSPLSQREQYLLEKYGVDTSVISSANGNGRSSGGARAHTRSPRAIDGDLALSLRDIGEAHGGTSPPPPVANDEAFRTIIEQQRVIAGLQSTINDQQKTISVQQTTLLGQTMMRASASPGRPLDTSSSIASTSDGGGNQRRSGGVVEEAGSSRMDAREATMSEASPEDRRARGTTTFVENNLPLQASDLSAPRNGTERDRLAAPTGFKHHPPKNYSVYTYKTPKEGEAAPADTRGPPDCTLEVVMGNGLVGYIPIREGDDADDLALSFVRTYKMNTRYVKKLSGMIRERMDQWKNDRRRAEARQQQEAYRLAREGERASLLASHSPIKLRSPRVGPLPPPVAKVHIDIGANKIGTIGLREGDDPYELARAFCKTWGIKEHHIQGVADRILKAMQDFNVSPSIDPAVLNDEATRARLDAINNGAVLNLTPPRGPAHHTGARVYGGAPDLDVGPLLFEMRLNLDDNRKEVVQLYEGSDPHLTAADLGRRHKLDPAMTDRVEKLIRQRLNAYRAKADASPSRQTM